MYDICTVTTRIQLVWTCTFFDLGTTHPYIRGTALYPVMYVVRAPECYTFPGTTQSMGGCNTNTQKTKIIVYAKKTEYT